MYLAGALLLAGGAYYIGGMRQSANCNISPACCSLRTNMRKLWSDHAWWTRNYLIAAIGGGADLQEATARLLKNQVDIGDAVASYYGKEAGDKLAALLKDHILIAADLVAAAKANNTANVEAADKKWRTNADEIAQFLSSANPNWPLKALQSMLYEHLDLTKNEAVARLKGEWKSDIATFEKVFDEIMMMSDAITNGIVKQFPGKF